MSSSTLDVEQNHTTTTLTDRLFEETGYRFSVYQETNSGERLADWQPISTDRVGLDLSMLPESIDDAPFFLEQPETAAGMGRLAIPIVFEGRSSRW